MDIDKFIKSQIDNWGLAADNYEGLATVEMRALRCGVRIQHNPARIASTGAKVDAKSIEERTCFLCGRHRPMQQKSLMWRNYDILLNPYPIFPGHLTIAARKHTPQAINGRIDDMVALAEELPGYTIFFNGAHCGASAPDHAHFQAVPTEALPIWEEIGETDADEWTTKNVFGSMGAAVYRIAAGSPTDALKAGTEIFPDINMLMRRQGNDTICIMIPRKRHRPSFYGTAADQMLISPASVDLGGVIIAPRREDYNKIDDAIVKRMLDEVCYSPSEIDIAMHSTVHVGIVTDTKLKLRLHGPFNLGGDIVTGTVEITARHVKEPLLFTPVSPESHTEVEGVTIGVNFHWQRRENQCFKGAIRIIKHDGRLTLVNEIDIEDYLTSVISSEMSAISSLELLKAHAVISRSWVLAQIRNKKKGSLKRKESPLAHPGLDTAGQHIVWYDHDDHQLFDVCADDHCQRYQGITRISSPTVVEAINATRGQVLTYNGELCDARFSKCCGGAMEIFESCWEDEPHPYLAAKRDAPESHTLPDLTLEQNAREWIMSSPEAFCNTTDADTLRQVLNHYDRETTPDFYRWQADYDTDTLSELIARKSGYDFGRIIDLIPLRRGPSARITRLRVIGEKLTMDIGKELEIRRCLSETHLYSSAFVVDRTADRFIIRGAGWGHGVGLCQIGAAIMASKGYTYRQILAHYYPGASISEKSEVKS